MADKVQKIRKKVVWLQKRAEHNFDISLTENERQFWLGESNVLTLIGKYIDTMQEEPHQELYDKLSNLRDDAFSNTTKESWEACLSEEPVSEDFEKAVEEQIKYFPVHEVEFAGRKICDAYDKNYLLLIAEFGAKWQKNHLWKPADGDYLPEYDREVVVFTQIFSDDAGMMMVAIGHRPAPEGFDGKSLTTGQVEHYTPKTYGKGGWNIPDVVYWLDVELPKEIEL